MTYLRVTERTYRTTDGRIIPYALFTDPELGRVGLTETQVREAGYNLKVGTIPMKWVARAIGGRVASCFATLPLPFLMLPPSLCVILPRHENKKKGHKSEVKKP